MSEKSQDGVVPDPNHDVEDLDAMRARIEAELAALGEAPLDSPDAQLELDDFDFAARGADVSLDADVATVATLASWADPEPDGALEDDLSELAMHRVWRTIERRAPAQASAEASPSTNGQADAPSGRRWGLVVAGLSIAAALLLIPVLVPSGPAPSDAETAAQTASRETSREDLDMLSEQAKRGLDALPGPHGTARVESMAQDYAQRLASTRGRG